MSNFIGFAVAGATQYSCRSGNTYTPDASGFIKAISPQDANDLESQGVALMGQPATPLAFRNIIDGGDFTSNPWQRGTSFTSISTSVVYTADRWFAAGTTTSSISVSQQANVTVPGFSQALQFGRASSDTHVSQIFLGQVLETLDCIRTQGLPVTLSFWAAAGANLSAATSTINVALNHSTTAGNDTAAHLVASSTNWQSTATIVNATQALTTTMTRYTFTGTVPSNATQLGLLLSYTPVGTAGANDNIQIMGVQLEYGEAATSFEHRDVALELELAQRYCYVLGALAGPVGTAGATSSTAFGAYINFPTPMRAAPTALAATTVTDLSIYSFANASVAALATLVFGAATPNGIILTGTVASGLTSGTGYVLQNVTALAGNLVFSADL